MFTPIFSPLNHYEKNLRAAHEKNVREYFALLANQANINLEENAKMKINNLVNVLNQSRAAIESSNRNISLAQKSYDMTSIAYRNGTTELLDVREAETQLNQAKLALASEKFNYLSGLLDLEFAINSKLTK